MTLDAALTSHCRIRGASRTTTAARATRLGTLPSPPAAPQRKANRLPQSCTDGVGRHQRPNPYKPARANLQPDIAPLRHLARKRTKLRCASELARGRFIPFGQVACTRAKRVAVAARTMMDLDSRSIYIRPLIFHDLSASFLEQPAVHHPAQSRPKPHSQPSSQCLSSQSSSSPVRPWPTPCTAARPGSAAVLLSPPRSSSRCRASSPSRRLLPASPASRARPHSPSMSTSTPSPLARAPCFL